ncbi:MAG TPA: isopeptide-forming domain-containing fimbrial protein [Actinomycetota bacterium]
MESGESFTYTITVTNTGDGTAEDVVVTDRVPSGLTITDVNGPGCSTSGQDVTCQVGDLAAGASVTITITVTATDDACPDVENSATVEWTEGGTTESEDSDPVETDVDCVGGETVTPPPPTVTPPDGTAFTGASETAVMMGFAAIALLILGSGLLFAGYRRRTSIEP